MGMGTAPCIIAIISFWLAIISWALRNPLACATLFICSKYCTVSLAGATLAAGRGALPN
jgi:hypothetical protein